MPLRRLSRHRAAVVSRPGSDVPRCRPRPPLDQLDRHGGGRDLGRDEVSDWLQLLSVPGRLELQVSSAALALRGHPRRARRRGSLRMRRSGVLGAGELGAYLLRAMVFVYFRDAGVSCGALAHRLLVPSLTLGCIAVLGHVVSGGQHQVHVRQAYLLVEVVGARVIIAPLAPNVIV